MSAATCQLLTLYLTLAPFQLGENLPPAPKSATSLPAYVTVDEVGVILQEMSDFAEHPSYCGNIEWDFRKDKACDHSRRILDFLWEASNPGAVISEHVLAWPRVRLILGEPGALKGQ
jgi:hypothetical protein